MTRRKMTQSAQTKRHARRGVKVSRTQKTMAEADRVLRNVLIELSKK